MSIREWLLGKMMKNIVCIKKKIVAKNTVKERKAGEDSAYTQMVLVDEFAYFDRMLTKDGEMDGKHLRHKKLVLQKSSG